MSLGIIGGNIKGIHNVSVAVAPASVAANTTAEQTFTLPFNVSTQMFAYASKPTLQAGLGISTSRVIPPNSIAITYINVTASPIVPTTENYMVMIMSAEGSSIPTTIGF